MRGFLVSPAALIVITSSVLGAQLPNPATYDSLVASGWHPWYEIKVDPASPRNLIVCGTKWDANQNAPFGVVYASSDGGKVWRTVLEDKNSDWVTEQSCAMGPNHRAYFISEASMVIDGQTHHDQGITRLFLSNDSGIHWAETISTGWADYSTSAVSRTSGELYTFFSSWMKTREQRNIGLLIFSADGKRVAGPFFDSSARASFNQSVFASHAVALKSGAVVAMYYGRRHAVDGWIADVGVLRVGAGEPSMESTVVAHPAAEWEQNCDTLSDNSLAYDPEHNRLFLAYVEGCKGKGQIVLTSSDDEGRTWTESGALVNTQERGHLVFATSLMTLPDDRLGLLWQEGRNQHSSRWLFSYIRQGKLVGHLIELSPESVGYAVSSDSLRTWISQPRGASATTPSEVSISVEVFSELNAVWRGSGLAASDKTIIAVRPNGGNQGVGLLATVIGATENTSPTVAIPNAVDADVTRHAVLLYRSQVFDSAANTLRLCLALASRGDDPIKVPIRIEALEVRSPVASISITDAANGQTGVGAVWDVSHSITGDQIPPRSTSNPFCLNFRLTPPSKGILPREAGILLALRVRVLSGESHTIEH